MCPATGGASRPARPAASRQRSGAQASCVLQDAFNGQCNAATQVGSARPPAALPPLARPSPGSSSLPARPAGAPLRCWRRFGRQPYRTCLKNPFRNPTARGDARRRAAQVGQANCSAAAGCAWQLDYGNGNPYNGFCYNAAASAACAAQGANAVACQALRDPATNLQMCSTQQARRARAWAGFEMCSMQQARARRGGRL